MPDQTHPHADGHTDANNKKLKPTMNLFKK